MRIIIVHNKYKERGGEDFVSNAEFQILKDRGLDIKLVTYDNSAINSSFDIFKTSYQSFYNSSVAKDLEEIIDAFQPDVIHVHNIFYIVSPSIFYVAHKKKVPVVLTLHNYRLICSGALLLRDNEVCELCIHKKLPLSGIKYKCHNNSYLQSLQLTLMTGFHKHIGTWRDKVNRYIVLTEFVKEKILSSSLNLKEEQVVVKANSTEDCGYAPKTERKDFFLFVGRLTEEKGVKILLKSAEIYNYSIKIIGDGPLRGVVENYEQRYENIEYLGFKNKDFILNELKNCKALIFPSTWYEGMPLTILEAFSTGTPIVCSNMNNLNNIIKDNINGLLFQPGDPNSLVDKIKAIQKSGDDSLYENARKSYEELYTPEKNYENLITIYKNLINKEQAKNKI